MGLLAAWYGPLTPPWPMGLLAAWYVPPIRPSPLGLLGAWYVPPVAKEGSTSGIRTQHPCLSGTVPYRLGYRGSHTLMGPSCYTAPPPQQAVSSRRT